MPSERLTVKDHLIFAACMKLGDSTTIDSRINEVIQELGLQHCAQTPLSLVSGGEKKRTSIGKSGYEAPVVTRPNTLFHSLSPSSFF